jgi:fatty acid CoA ligase FadD36
VLRFGEESLGAAELLAASGAVADRVAGARAVAVVAEPSPATVVAVVGCLTAGVPVVPVPPDSGPLERRHILSDSGAELVLGGPSWRGDSVEPVDPGATGSGSHAERPAGETAFVIYTSGTTGPPKGVALSRRAVAANLDALADAWGWMPEDTLVHGLPLFHVHGLILGILGPLRLGCRVVHTLRPTPAAYAAAGGTLYFGVPTVWSRVGEDRSSAEALRSARLLVSGSAPLPEPVFRRLEQLTGNAPVERYGMTETLITLSTRAAGSRRPGTVGMPLAGVETRLAGDAGELEVRCPTMFEGYVNKPAETAECYTADGWFRTGDAAEIDRDGHHRIVGRLSVDLIKSGGYRIGAGEVEAALLTHPAVVEAAVIGLADADLGQKIVAFVVTTDRVAASEISEHVAIHLSVHKRPREVRFVSELPRNAMGKVLKTELK